MPRDTTCTALAVTTLMGLVAIAQIAMPSHIGTHAVAATSIEQVGENTELAAYVNSASVTPLQRAVLLEGFDWEPLLTLERPSIR